jgi:hypothetical protein
LPGVTPQKCIAAHDMQHTMNDNTQHLHASLFCPAFKEHSSTWYSLPCKLPLQSHHDRDSNDPAGGFLLCACILWRCTGVAGDHISCRAQRLPHVQPASPSLACPRQHSPEPQAAAGGVLCCLVPCLQSSRPWHGRGGRCACGCVVIITTWFEVMVLV